MDYDAIDGNGEVQKWRKCFVASLRLAFLDTNPSLEENLNFSISEPLSAADYLIHHARMEIEAYIGQQESDVEYTLPDDEDKKLSEYKYEKWQEQLTKFRVIQSDIYAIQCALAKLEKMG